MSPEYPILEGSVVMAIVSIALAVYYKRAKSEGALDDRSVKQVDQRDELIATLSTRNETLEQRNREWSDRYYTLTQENMRLAQSLGDRVLAAVEEIRRKHDESMARVWSRVEKTEREQHEVSIKLAQCEQGHRACREETAGLRAELATLREETAAVPSQMRLPAVGGGN